MKRILFLAAPCLSASLWASDASACRVPYRPVEPMYENFSGAAFATVMTGDQDGATLDVGSVLHGSVPVETADLSFVTLGGDCGPGGPTVAPGETVVIYFQGDWLRRWARAMDVVSKDPYVAAAFLSAVNPKASRDLAGRAALVQQFRGPVPDSDPALWASPFDGSLRTTSSNPVSRARFQVKDDGTVGDCRIFVSTKRSEKDDNLVCEALQKRARFKPPLLSQEREGIYEVRWGGEPVR